MNTITKDQLRFAQSSGIVDKASIHSEGSQFQVIVRTTTGQESQLVAARTKEPRTFANPANALSFLHGIGITKGEFNTKNWTPKAVESQPTLQPLSNDKLKNILCSMQQSGIQDASSSQSAFQHNHVQVDVAALAASMRRC